MTVIPYARPRRTLTLAAKFWLVYFTSLMALVVWCLHAFSGEVLL